MHGRNTFGSTVGSIAASLVIALAAVSCSSSDGASESVPPVAADAEPSTTEPEQTQPAQSDPAPEPEATDPVRDSTPESADTAPPETAPNPEPVEARIPSVEALGDLGAGTVAPLSSARIPDGYTETEFSFTGEAAGYEAVGLLGSDGVWRAEESGSVAPFASRMIVRAPSPEEFSGVVLVEWNNVTAGTDTTPDWGFLHEMIGREGHAYVAVSAQFVGVMGDDGSFLGDGVADVSGLPARDPVRYGDLVHPGDEFAFDIFSQAGAAIRHADMLDGLEPVNMIALGESQSAFFMAGYVNAIHPLVELYDGFLVHSRGGTAVRPDGQRGDGGPDFVNIRTDLDEPVLQYVTETDLFGLGFLPARQPDSDSVRTWEVAGTAHADAYSLFASGLERDAGAGTILGCETPINDGPQHETLSAAVFHLIGWVVDGVLPPVSPLLDVDGDALVRDELGIATGGVRTPVVDAPLRLLSGEPGPDGGACFLFGQSVPFDDGVIASLYGSLDDWVGAAQTAADFAVESGWLLAEDAATMLDEANAFAVSAGLR